MFTSCKWRAMPHQQSDGQLERVRVWSWSSCIFIVLLSWMVKNRHIPLASCFSKLILSYFQYTRILTCRLEHSRWTHMAYRWHIRWFINVVSFYLAATWYSAKQIACKNTWKQFADRFPSIWHHSTSKSCDRESRITNLWTNSIRFGPHCCLFFPHQQDIVWLTCKEANHSSLCLYMPFRGRIICYTVDYTTIIYILENYNFKWYNILCEWVKKL